MAVEPVAYTNVDGRVPPAGPCVSEKHDGWVGPASVAPESAAPASLVPPSLGGPASGTGAVGHAVPASAQSVLRFALSKGSHVLEVQADSSCALSCGEAGQESGLASLPVSPPRASN